MDEPYPFLIGGEWRTGDAVFAVRYPYDGSLTARVSLAGEKDVEDAIRAAVTGFERTRLLPVYDRMRILHRVADAIEARADELAGVLIREAGKTRQAAVAEVARAVDTMHLSAEEADRIFGELLPLDRTEGGAGRLGLVRRFPVGPVVGITPFNYPLNLACHKLGPAIAAGNAFLLKPSTKTPLSALILGGMVLDAGFPPQAISVVPCAPERAERFVTDPRIAYVSFTGSPEVGWRLKQLAGQKRIGLELGGNAAVIVHEDAPVSYAASRIVQGAFSNAGQVCISVQRVYAHRAICGRLEEALRTRMQALKVGDPADPSTDVGPMISRAAADAACAKLDAAVSGGATLVLGGDRDGTLVTPALLKGTTPEMAVNRTEMFAPVITLIPYDRFDEAVSLVNDSPFGLQAGLFTRDVGLILRAHADLRVGGLIAGDIPTFRTDAMPYGGVKGSGIGREGPRYAIEEMTEMRMLVLDTAMGRE